MVQERTIEGVTDITYREDDILVMKMHKTSIDIEAAKKITEVANELAGNTVHANLVDIRDMIFMSSEARKYFGGQNKNTVKAVAVVINSKLHRPIVNLYLKFSRPSLPTKMFDDIEQAIEWLKEKL